MLPQKAPDPFLIMRKIEDYSLYLVITEEYGKGRSAHEIALAAIKGGVDIIQMREKKKSRAELLALGRKLSGLCKSSRVTFIVNDDPALALAVEADGVHLGQEDIKKHSIPETRKILGRDKIIGISTDSIETFEKACKEDVDYIAYGPVFPTKIKESCVGVEDAGKLTEMTKKPVVFIGGIDLSNIGYLLQKGARNISLIRAITESDDVAIAARSFRKRLDDFKRKEE